MATASEIGPGVLPLEPDVFPQVINQGLTMLVLVRYELLAPKGFLVQQLQVVLVFRVVGVIIFDHHLKLVVESDLSLVEVLRPPHAAASE